MGSWSIFKLCAGWEPLRPDGVCFAGASSGSQRGEGLFKSKDLKDDLGFASFAGVLGSKPGKCV